MSAGGRFRYTLEPVLVSRQWTLDALQRQLNELNGAIAARRAGIEALEERYAQGADQLRAAIQGADFRAASVMVFKRYVDDLCAQMQVQHEALREQESERAAQIERTVLAQKAVEAVEQHRDGMRSKHAKAQLSEQCKLADDNWTILQERKKHAHGI